MIYCLENEYLKVHINSLGAELWSLVDKRSGTEHLWQGDPSIWPRRAPTLFPYCGRLREGRFILKGHLYEASIHGFARDLEHDTVSHDNASITFCLKESDTTLLKYPYAFSLYTRYRLEQNALIQSFEVVNASEEEMFFSIGYHTGYRVPFDENHTIQDYHLVFDQEETPVELLCNETGLLSGEKRTFFDNRRTLPLRDDLFDTSFILSGLKSSHVSLIEKDTGKYVKVSIKDFPYLVLWSTPKKVPFICLEPCFGLPDLYNTQGQFDKKPGIIKLLPDDPFSCTMTIEIG